ncbi:MAG: hypothetical protein A2070_05500 [Bdellovibrionales bacterium GWC1_52_8]|nr:MAG: hypothetical protein A2X97_11240 [Bdellovibrionales bacterium GWA1_52_35]OFZ42307.1 MAG: hypothetical protein A2070_05500 [Bdellovibrionales bacterium GWC1_52_8]HCM39191.1 protein TolR [Bdellovibrionales bacterium]
MALKTWGRDEGDLEGAIVAEINITPLTDIFLVLLIIFMVTSSVMAQLGVNVNLPQASQALSEAQADGVIVTLTPSGALLVNQQKVDQGQKTLEDALKIAFQQAPSRLVILEGDRQTLLGSAIRTMDRARAAGAEKFAIATNPEAQGQ